MKFKIGDKVRRIRGKFANVNVGDISTVIEVEYGECKLDKGDKSLWHDMHNLELVENAWDNLEAGDKIIDRIGNEMNILGVCGKVFLVSTRNCEDYGEYFYTKEYCIKRGFKIKQPTPVEEVKEMTVADVEKLVGKKVKIIK